MLLGEKTVRGAKVFYDRDVACKRWLEAVGRVKKWRLEPGQALATGYGLTNTVVNSSTLAAGTTAGSGWIATTDTAEYDGVNVQVTGAPFELQSNKPFWFHGKLQADEATQVDILLALAGTSTALLATATAHGVNSTNFKGAGFLKVAGGTVLSAQVYNASGAQAAYANFGSAFAASTDYDLDIEYTGEGANFYIQGLKVLSVAASSLPNTALTPSLNVRAGTGSAARTVQLKDCYIYQVVA